jgi:DNA-binding transcriptional LysR family regulator
MEVRRLRYFGVLAEQLHFTKAALLLNVAQPALSHQIKLLEEELGTQLVERSNGRVRLTAAGEVFRDRAARILEQLYQVARETARAGQGEAGSLVVGAVSTAVCSILPEILRGIRRDAPSIAIDIREMEPAEHVEALRRETIDIGLLFLAIQDSAFDSLVVSRERLIVALPTGHSAATQERVRLSDLATETFLIPGSSRFQAFTKCSGDTSFARDSGAATAADQIAANGRLLGGGTSGCSPRTRVIPEPLESSRLRIS